MSEPSISPLFQRIINPSGGLSYHYIAWRYRTRLWQGFTAELEQLLLEWRASLDEDKIVLIGPNAGYNLTPAFVSQFSALVAVEPDPIACWLLRRRFNKDPITFDQRDYFGFTRGEIRSTWATDLKAQYPGHAILFCNILGQVPHLLGQALPAAQVEKEFARFKSQLRDELKDLRWASFHDSYSYPTRDASETRVVTDHLTSNVLTNPKLHRILKWQREPSSTHVIEAVFI